MPVETLQSQQQPFDTHVVVGSLSPNEVVEAQRRYFSNGETDTTRPILWDVRGIERRTDSQEIFKMVEDSTAFWSLMAGGKTAILVRGRGQLSGARLYMKLAEAMPRQLQVFTDYEDAVSWLTGNAAAYDSSAAFSEAASAS